MKRMISYEDVERACGPDFIPEQILNKVDYIIGISRGGLVPARLVSRATGRNVPILTLAYQSYIAEDAQGQGRWLQRFDRTAIELLESARVLVVDDLLDTGHTLEAVSKYLRANTAVDKIYFFVPYSKQPPGSQWYAKPNFFYAYQTPPDEWLVFTAWE